jgi:hypothetical protein
MVERARRARDASKRDLVPPRVPHGDLPIPRPLARSAACRGRASVNRSGSETWPVTANTYSHVLTDETELDYGRLLAEAAKIPGHVGPNGP